MKNVLLLYGWHGSDAPHWQDWLAKQLIEEGYSVSFPQLSDNMKPKKSVWMQEAKAAYDAIKPDIVIAHSMGNILWLHLCAEDLVDEVSHLLMVAPPRDLGDIDEIKTFFPVSKSTSVHAKNALMVVSDNDPYMGLEESKSLSAQLGIQMKILHNAGHINSDSGYGSWQWVLDWVREANDIKY